VDFELSYEFLRGPDFRGSMPGPSAANPEGYSELEQIVGFYNARNGSFDDFLLDPALLSGRCEDSQVRGAQIGIGDGTTTQFFLQRNYGGFMDEVQDPVGPIFVSDNGALVAGTAWTLGTVGDINFTTAPLTGHVITADFQWRWRVAFAEDALGLEAFMYQLYELQSVKLEQVKR
jgi:uncharacterized protein (TIGR02217 family)